MSLRTMERRGAARIARPDELKPVKYPVTLRVVYLSRGGENLAYELKMSRLRADNERWRLQNSADQNMFLAARILPPQGYDKPTVLPKHRLVKLPSQKD